MQCICTHVVKHDLIIVLHRWHDRDDSELAHKVRASVSWLLNKLVQQPGEFTITTWMLFTKNDKFNLHRRRFSRFKLLCNWPICFGLGARNCDELASNFSCKFLVPVSWACVAGITYYKPEKAKIANNYILHSAELASCTSNSANQSLVLIPR